MHTKPYSSVTVRWNQITISQNIEKNHSMYAREITICNIESHRRKLCGIDISSSTINQNINREFPIAKGWKENHLEEVDIEVFSDEIQFYVHSRSSIIKGTIYIAAGFKAFYLQTEIRNCVIHRIYNTTREAS